MLLITVTPATGVGLIFSRKGFFSIGRNYLPGLVRSGTMYHVRVKHGRYRMRLILLLD